MNEETKIKLIKKLEVTDMTGDKVMIDFETGKYFMLRGTACDIWDAIQKDTTVGAIKNYLQQIYEVDDVTCMTDIARFLNQLKSNGFISID